MIDSKPRFLQGAFYYTGKGYDAASLLDPKLVYTVPFDKRAQLIYARLGNSSAEMVCLSLLCDGKPIRLFPIGAKASAHVPLAGVDKVTVTVSVWPKSTSLMATAENGDRVASSVTVWPAFVPAITGGSLTAVAMTVVVLLLDVPHAVSVALR